MQHIQRLKQSAMGFGILSFSALIGILTVMPTAKAKPAYTIVQEGTISGLNDNGAVTGNAGLSGFLRTPDGTMTLFRAPGDRYGTTATAINSEGAIAGYFDTPDDAVGVDHGFIRNPDGTFVTFDAPGATGIGTIVTAINGSGDVVGESYDQYGMAQGFLRRANGEFETIDVQQSRWTAPGSINDKGAVAGDYIPEQGNSPNVGFVRSPKGKITTFVAPGSVSGTNVIGINKAGTVTGTYYYPRDNDNMARGYVRTSDGTFTTFDVSGYYTDPAGLNAKNIVVGAYSTQGNKGFGFLRKSDGSFEKIQVPGASGSSAIGINSNGVVVGNFSVRTGRHSYSNYGFIRTP